MWFTLIGEYNEKTGICHVLIQTETHSLYRVNVHARDIKENIANRIAEIANVTPNRVAFKKERKLKKQQIQFVYYVFDDAPF